ncbi:coiled-coil domain-containing protein 89 [Rhinoderma darwinii]|uniref:coiled-coil domain-containing protein 89 n=1 Tax=Rhinoderma darwinii TaxID=43563 RepID=UPI003F6767CF
MPGESGENPGSTSVGNVTSLPWDEKKEIGMLRSRLDEQSQLICLLKRRADDTLLRCQGLERDNQERERRSAETEGLLTAERRRGEQLEERFGILAANHQDMIRFKDEYKRQNQELRAECQRLRENTYPELLEKERNIQDLRAQLQATSAELRDHEKSRRAEIEELRGRNATSTGENHTLTQRLQLSEETCHHLQQKWSLLEDLQKNEQKEAEKKMAELNKEKQDLLHLCMERGRSLQERQKEAAEITHRLQSAEKARREAGERYQRNVTAVDADARIVELNTRLVDREKELAQQNREFEAYKKHSGELLAKERELNAKLRHLIG